MKVMIGNTDPFMSPVTGELASFNQIPQADYGEILVAGLDGYFSPSLSLIDAKIDINYLKKITDDLNESSVVLKTESLAFPNAQVLNSLSNGYLIKGEGGVLTTSLGPTPPPPFVLELPEGELYIGGSDNIATHTKIITIDNLPNLGVTNIAGAELPLGRVWRGTQDDRPEESDALSIVEVDIGLINGRFLLTNFILGSALVEYTYPRAQYLSNLPDNVPLATLGPALIPAPLAPDMVWMGSADGLPIEAPYVSAEELEELVEEAQGFRDEAEGFAEAAEGSAGEAAASALEASGAATEATGAAGDASLSAIAAGASALASAGSAISAGISASDADTYSQNAKQSEINAAGSATSSLNYLNTLLATGLNGLPCTGDVSFQGYKIINLGDPTNPTDGMNKRTHDADIERLQNEIDNIEPSEPAILDGFVVSETTVDGVTPTIAGPLAKLSLIPAGGDVSFEGHRATDLSYIPQSDNDGVNVLFMWNLLNDRII